MPDFAILTSVALKSTVVLAAAWIAARLLRKRSAALRYQVWTAALVSALVLPCASAFLPSLRVSPAILPDMRIAVAGTAASAQPLHSHVSLPRATAARAWHPDWRTGLMLLWAAGAACSLLQMTRGYASACRLWRSARRLSSRQGVEIREAAAECMPMTVWLGRPVILLPAVAGCWSTERYRLVLGHELAHACRGDAGMHLLARAAVSLYWWNPLVWLAWREFQKECEHATDDAVLRTGARPSDYARDLLELAREYQTRSAVSQAALAMAHRPQLEARLRAILDAHTDRTPAGRGAVLATTLAAAILVLPLAAVRAQQDTRVPIDIDAAVRAAQSQQNYKLLDEAAAAAVETGDQTTAGRLLEAALVIREKAAGADSPEYAAGLIRLAELQQKSDIQSGGDRLAQAIQILGERPPAGCAMIDLGMAAMARKDYAGASAWFLHAQTVDAEHAGLARMWLALVRQQEGNPAEAERLYQSALASNSSPRDQAVIARVYSGFLRTQKRDDEAQAQEGRAAYVRSVPALPAGVNRVGHGVTPPAVETKIEPDYSEPARLARLQGTAVVQVVIGSDGRVRSAHILRELGLGLDENALAAIHQWRFKPAVKDGQAVAVAATIEVNFRLL